MLLTQKDFLAIRNIVRSEVKGGLAVYDLSVEKRFADVMQRINFLPTKEEFYSKMDRLMSEIKTYRQEHLFLNSRLARLEQK